jgi:hypothetical protein
VGIGVGAGVGVAVGPAVFGAADGVDVARGVDGALVTGAEVRNPKSKRGTGAAPPEGIGVKRTDGDGADCSCASVDSDSISTP